MQDPGLTVANLEAMERLCWRKALDAFGLDDNEWGFDIQCNSPGFLAYDITKPHSILWRPSKSVSLYCVDESGIHNHGP